MPLVLVGSKAIKFNRSKFREHWAQNDLRKDLKTGMWRLKRLGALRGMSCKVGDRAAIEIYSGNSILRMWLRELRRP